METIPYTIYIEGTPNPSSMKFVANKQLITEKGATAEYKNIADTQTAPIAKKIISVSICKNHFYFG